MVTGNKTARVGSLEPVVLVVVRADRKGVLGWPPFHVVVKSCVVAMDADGAASNVLISGKGHCKRIKSNTVDAQPMYPGQACCSRRVVGPAFRINPLGFGTPSGSLWKNLMVPIFVNYKKA